MSLRGSVALLCLLVFVDRHVLISSGCMYPLSVHGSQSNRNARAAFRSCFSTVVSTTSLDREISPPVLWVSPLLLKLGTPFAV